MDSWDEWTSPTCPDRQTLPSGRNRKSAVWGFQRKTGAVSSAPRLSQTPVIPDRIGSDMELDLLKALTRHTQGRYPHPSHESVKAAIERMRSTRIALGMRPERPQVESVPWGDCDRRKHQAARNRNHQQFARAISHFSATRFLA